MSQARIYRLFVDSLVDRSISSGETPQNFTVQLPKSIVPDIKDVHVLSCVFPNLIPTFSQYNNTFSFRNATAGINYSISLASLFWATGTDFATYLQGQMNALTPGFTVTYSLATGKLTTVNSLIGFQIFNNTTATIKCQKKVGFYGNGAGNNPSTAVGVPLTASGMLNLLGTTSVYLVSNNLCPGQSLTGNNLSSSPVQFNVLLKIPVLVSAYQLNSYTNTFYDLKYDVVDGQYRDLHFAILDDNYDPIVFGGDNCGFQLHLEISYTESRF